MVERRVCKEWRTGRPEQEETGDELQLRGQQAVQ